MACEGGNKSRIKQNTPSNFLCNGIPKCWTMCTFFSCAYITSEVHRLRCALLSKRHFRTAISREQSMQFSAYKRHFKDICTYIYLLFFCNNLSQYSHVYHMCADSRFYSLCILPEKPARTIFQRTRNQLLLKTFSIAVQDSFTHRFEYKSTMPRQLCFLCKTKNVIRITHLHISVSIALNMKPSHNIL